MPAMPRLFCLFLAGSSFALAESKTLTLAAVDQRTVTVDAVAIAKAMPDRLEWHLQIKSVKSTVKESRADVDASIQRLVMALKSAGIPEKALVVSDVEQGREREWSGRKWNFKGYSSLSEIRLTLTDFKLAHRIQSEVLADDLITVRSMDQISDREGELRQKALAQAAQVAQKRRYSPLRSAPRSAMWSRSTRLRLNNRTGAVAIRQIPQMPSRTKPRP